MEIMIRKLISTGSPFERIGGYSRAVVQGNFVFVSGTAGYDYSTMIMPDSVTEQAHNCFKNISAALLEAGCSLHDVVRANYIVSEARFIDLILPICGEYFHSIRPACTMIIAELIKPEIKIEIEVTAMIAQAYGTYEIIGDR
jgi:enamine deaminase RidA (YjgF/YER057c/UK114 family)